MPLTGTAESPHLYPKKPHQTRLSVPTAGEAPLPTLPLGSGRRHAPLPDRAAAGPRRWRAGREGPAPGPKGGVAGQGRAGPGRAAERRPQGSEQGHGEGGGAGLRARGVPGSGRAARTAAPCQLPAAVCSAAEGLNAGYRDQCCGPSLSCPACTAPAPCEVQ